MVSSPAIVEILFSKQPLRAMVLEIISVHKIEVSEGVSIFYKEEKENQYMYFSLWNKEWSDIFQIFIC